MKFMNALMPGEHNYQMGMPMPGQTPQADPALAPQKKRGPVMNALSGFFEFGAPEAFEAGRQKRLTRDLGQMMAGGDYEAAAQRALMAGNLDQGEQLRGIAGQRADQQAAQAAEARKAEAQKTLQLFQAMQPAQLVEFAHMDPVGFEQATGMTSEEYIQSAQRMMQAGMQPEQFHQYVIQQAQAELGMGGGEPYTLAPGAARYGPDGKMIAQNPVAEKPQGPLSTLGKLRADLDAGRITQAEYDGEVARIQRGEPSLSMQFGEGGSLAGITYGSAQKGQESALVRTREGGAAVSPGPQQEAYNKARRGVDEFIAQNSIVLGDIDKALETVGPYSTGAGSVLKDLPIVGGLTPAGQMESLLETIRANVGFDKLQAMRESSPTGGALGNVTERELGFLQAVFGSMRQDLSPENVTRNLTRLRNHMAGREQRIREAFEADFPTLQQTADFRSRTNQQVQALSAAEAAELEQLRRELGAQ